MDYAPDVTGNAPIAHYTHDPKRFDNFFFPTRRLVHLRDARGKADHGFAGITLVFYFVSVKCDRMVSKQIELLSVVQLLDCA